MNSVRRLPLSPPKGAQKRKVTVFRYSLRLICDNFEAVRDRMSVLIINRKSHRGFGLVSTSVTLNDPERHNSPYFALFHRIR